MEQISKSLKDNSVKSDLNSSFEFIASKVNATEDEYFKVDWDLKEANKDGHFAEKTAMKTDIHIGSCDLNSPKLDDSKDEYFKVDWDLKEANKDGHFAEKTAMKTDIHIGSCDLNTPKLDDSKDEYFKVDWDLKEANKDGHFAEKTAMKTDIHIGSCDLNSPKLDDSKADSDSSVEIINHGLMFSPYKSDLEREWSEEDRIFEQQDKVYENRIKRVKRLSKEWNWSEVIELDGSDEEEKNLFKNYTNSANKKSPLKIPKVSIQKRTRPHLV